METEWEAAEGYRENSDSHLNSEIVIRIVIRILPRLFERSQ